MNDLEFVSIWAICAFVVCFIAGTVSYVNDEDNAAMVQMTAKGASPIQARCAIKGITDSMCAKGKELP